MNLIIATSDTGFGKLLRDNLKKIDIGIVDIVSSEEDLLHCLLANPNTDGILLKTDLAKKQDDYRLELLSDVVNNIRLHPKFEKVVFTILSDYPEGHPLLAEFFEMGIYNIFPLGKSANLKKIVDSFNTPMSFAMAKNYRIANPEIPWRRNLSKPQTLNVNFGTDQKANASIDDDIESSDSKLKRFLTKPNLKILSKPNSQATDETDQDDSEIPEENEKEEIQKSIDDSWLFEDIDHQPKVSNQIIGTVIIAVTAVQEHLGSTNTAISIASFLQKNGYDVALVEGNTSMDFDCIHSLIEGERIPLSDIEFSYRGFDHIKYRETIDLGEVYTNYQYVVLDLGDIRNSPYRDELNRAHIKCVVASANEWKYHWIQEFLLNYDSHDLKFLIPCSDYKETNDLAARLKYYDVFPLDKHSNPYLVPEGSAKIYNQLLENYKSRPRFGLTGKHLLMTGLLGSIITAIIFSFLKYF